MTHHANLPPPRRVRATKECCCFVSLTSIAQVQGLDFNFASRKDMEKAMKQGQFLEISEVDGDLYGTTVESVVKLMEQGRICVLRIDLEGVQQLKSSAINPVSFHYVRLGTARHGAP